MRVTVVVDPGDAKVTVRQGARVTVIPLTAYTRLEQRTNVTGNHELCLVAGIEVAHLPIDVRIADRRRLEATLAEAFGAAEPTSGRGSSGA